MTALKGGWSLFAITLLASIITWYIVPADVQIPLHWGPDGQPDRFGSALEGLAIAPGVMLVILGIFSVLKYLEPRQENLAKSDAARGGIALAVCLMMTCLGGAHIGIALGYDVPMIQVVIIAIGLMEMVMGNFLSKTRSNFFIGIRTPWTLSSDVIWQKTHRLAGRLFMLAGFILFIAGWVMPASNFAPFLVGTLLPGIFVPMIYSWWLWRQDEAGKTDSHA